MSRVPSLSRRVLQALAANLIQPSVRQADATAIERTFITLLAACNRQAEALETLDRLAEPITNLTAAAPIPATAQAAADRTADAVADLASTLLLAPTVRRSDLHLKLVVLIAASEPHPADAHTFPSLYLRAILADLLHDHRLTRR